MSNEEVRSVDVDAVQDQNPDEVSLVKTDSTANQALDHYKNTVNQARKALLVKLDALRIRTKNEDEEKIISNLIKKMNPTRKGRADNVDRGWAVPTIRVVQRVTKEKPEGSSEGDLYTTQGIVLPQPFKFTPLYIYTTNRMFVEGSNAPECFSPDAKMGHKYGMCANCVQLPMGLNKTGKVTDCDNGLNFIVFNPETGLYILEFFKTNRRIGAKLDMKAGDIPWSRWFLLKSKMQSDKSHEWYTMNVVPTSEETSDDIAEMADYLCDFIGEEREAFLSRFYAAGDPEEALNSVEEPSHIIDADSGSEPSNPDFSSGAL